MAHLTNFSFEFFNKIFTEDASLPLLYHGAKKVKNDQKLKSKGGGGSCLQDRTKSLGVIVYLFCWVPKIFHKRTTRGKQSCEDQAPLKKMIKMILKPEKEHTKEVDERGRDR